MKGDWGGRGTEEREDEGRRQRYNRKKETMGATAVRRNGKARLSCSLTDGASTSGRGWNTASGPWRVQGDRQRPKSSNRKYNSLNKNITVAIQQRMLGVATEVMRDPCCAASKFKSNSILHGSPTRGKLFQSSIGCGVTKSTNDVGRATSCRTMAMKGFETVGDIMTTAPLVSCNEEMSVDAALQLVVDCRVTGLPVVDEESKVVGVVSDYDLLALEDICGSNIVQPEERNQVGDMFPPPGATWKAFNEVQQRLAKSKGKKVADVMTACPTVVRPYTNLEDAARILLSGRFRRLPVVDNDNRLIGILTRGNIVRAALLVKRLKDKKAEEEAKV